MDDVIEQIGNFNISGPGLFSISHLSHKRGIKFVSFLPEKFESILGRRKRKRSFEVSFLTLLHVVQTD